MCHLLQPRRSGNIHPAAHHHHHHQLLLWTMCSLQLLLLFPHPQLTCHPDLHHQRCETALD
jgi:hypothetical protein